MLEESKQRSKVTELGRGRIVTDPVRVQVILEPSFAMPIVQYYELTKLTPFKQMEAGCFQCHNEVNIDSNLHLKVQDGCYFIILET